MKKLFTLKEVRSKIFLLEFDHEYDMCMMFLRYQEYYESSFSKFRGKSFKILDFMRAYSLEFGKGAFTYPIDWSGFNINSDIIKNVRALGIPDENDYDFQMLTAWNKCIEKTDGEKFYLIGTTKGGDALDHEIAHGFFYLNKQYKKEMTKLVKGLAPDVRQAMNEYLTKLGYTPKVFVDEIQANLGTFSPHDGDDFTNVSRYPFSLEMATKLNKAVKPFIEVFKRYYDEQ